MSWTIYVWAVLWLAFGLYLIFTHDNGDRKGRK